MENDGKTNLQLRREAAGLTRYGLAKLAGMTERGIAKWERNGTSKAYAGHLKKAADALGCKVDDLL